jgi:DNA invertase Pin-like site-specific DNA recombinase
MAKVFAYLRVSGIAQTEGDGFPRQREAITAYCEAHGLEVKEWFEEEGVSGTLPGEDRPAWMRLWNALEANGTKIVIIERLDRLARALMVQETLLADLKKHGFEIISTAESDLDSTDPTRVLIRQVLGAVAQYDRAMITAKLKAARNRNSAALGHRVEGRKRFGARPGEDATLARMKELKASGQSFAAIANELNTSGLGPRGGKKWFRSSVQQTLKHA